MRPRDCNVNYINTSLLHQHLVYKHTTLTLSTTLEHDKLMATVCEAYKRLDDNLKRSCKSYGLLCQDGDLGKQPGMYVDHDEYKEKKPADHTSDYLRGGVINTVATFEAFVGDLLNEATDLVANHWDKDKKHLEGINIHMFKRCQKTKEDRQKPKDILLHNWDIKRPCGCKCNECTKGHKGLYSKCLLKDDQLVEGTSIIDIMLGQGSLEFEHIIRHGDVKGTSTIEIKPGTDDKCFICIMLRFCYGIRNVMAHGNAYRTFEGEDSALKDFPRCKLCTCTGSCSTCDLFTKMTVFLEKYNKYIEELPDDEEKIRVKKVVRRTHPPDECFDKFKKNPQLTFFQNNAEWLRYVTQPPPTPDSPTPPTPLHVSHAYFHLVQIYYWLVESERGMYVTFGLFERITKFIHTLASRMYLAVAELLIKNFELDDVWEMKKDLSNREDLIRNNQESLRPLYMYMNVEH